MNLEKQIILVTGAAGGLGSMASNVLAKNGATIILLDKNLPALERVYDEILTNGGVQPILYPFDLANASQEDYETLGKQVDEKYGVLHGLLHSAVEFKSFTPLIQFDLMHWGQVLNVNLNAAFLLTRTLLPIMQKAHSASIVFTSDAMAREHRAYSGAYGVSKVALEALAQIWAQELMAGGKIRVNTLIPGAVNSPLRQRTHPAEDKTKIVSMNSLAGAYLYLFSQQSLQVNGQIIDAQSILELNPSS